MKAEDKEIAEKIGDRGFSISNGLSDIQDPSNNFLFLNFLKFLSFYFKAQSFRLIMESNFIQMAASANHAVAYTIDPIFKHIIDCV